LEAIITATCDRYGHKDALFLVIGPFNNVIQPFIKTLKKDEIHAEIWKELRGAKKAFDQDVDGFKKELAKKQAAWKKKTKTLRVIFCASQIR